MLNFPITMASFTPPFIFNLPNELLLKIALIASERNKWGGPAVHRWPSSLFWNDRPHDLVMARNLCLVNRRFRDIGREVLYADIEFMPEYEASEQSISYLVRTLDEIPSLKQLIKRVILYASSPLSYQKAHKLLLDVTPDLRSFAVYSQDFYFLENQDVQEFWSTCRTFSPNIGKLQLSGINHTQLAGLVSFWDSFASLKSLNLRLELESPLQPALNELNLKLELDKGSRSLDVRYGFPSSTAVVVSDLMLTSF